MKAHRPEVADVFRSQARSYLAKRGRATSKEQRRVLKDIVSCRTAALGGHVARCTSCGHREIYYNSCRNRHCPKCQAAGRAEWFQARAADLLNVQYFHVVFTVPENLGPLALQNKRLFYGIFFRAVSETLQTIAKDPKRLGAHIGFIAILHTWGQTMHYHPHVHCVIPGGGLSLDEKRWIPSRKDFFLPVKVLSRLFRSKILACLEEAYRQNELSFFGKQEHLKDAKNWKRFVWALRATEWVVYAKPPFGCPKQVLKYLARYTHRVAMANQRLISLKSSKVTFFWKDYADCNRKKKMTLDADEFVRRFLLHVLPPGFMRIRHYGFLSNRNRKKKLPLCRKLIGSDKSNALLRELPVVDSTDAFENDSATLCPFCKHGRLVITEHIEPVSTQPLFCSSRVPYDTS